MRHYLFLTTNNFASNPRLLKEIKLALENGHRVTALTFKLNNWSDSKSKTLINQLHSEIPQTSFLFNEVKLEAIPDNKFKWCALAFLEFTSRKLSSIMPSNVYLCTLGHSRRSYQLLNIAKNLEEIPNIICAHNLGALYPAYKLGEFWNIPFTFDVEDYHPGETVLYDRINEIKRRELLMKKLLPKADAITFASPLIGQHTLKLIGEHNRTATIINCFEESEFNGVMDFDDDHIIEGDRLKLIWFGQKISFGRGLEQLFEAFIALDKKDNKIYLDLTLIGDLDKNFKKKVIDPYIENNVNNQIKLIIYDPMPQKDLHKKLSEHDVGLALELKDTDFNRQLCLTNKIIAYFQAGLYIFATNTLAQKQFINTYTNMGMLAGQSTEEILQKLIYIFRDKVSIKSTKELRYSTGMQVSWNLEKKKLLNIWNQIY